MNKRVNNAITTTSEKVCINFWMSLLNALKNSNSWILLIGDTHEHLKLPAHNSISAHLFITIYCNILTLHYQYLSSFLKSTVKTYDTEQQNTPIGPSNRGTLISITSPKAYNTPKVVE